MDNGEPLGPEAERYVAEAADQLSGLPFAVQTELVAEIRAHLLLWCEEQGVSPRGLAYAEAIAELGPPAELGQWFGSSESPVPPPSDARRWVRFWPAAAALPLAAVIGILAHAGFAHVPRLHSPLAGRHVGTSAPSSAATGAEVAPPVAAEPVSAAAHALLPAQVAVTVDEAHVAAAGARLQRDVTQQQQTGQPPPALAEDQTAYRSARVHLSADVNTLDELHMEETVLARESTCLGPTPGLAAGGTAACTATAS